jgi:hypothetical protein
LASSHIMPAMLEDPTVPVIHRTSGLMPFPAPGGALPAGIAPRQVTLRDRVTVATIIPFSAPNQVPLTLLAYLCDQLGREIEKGDTYPMSDPLSLETFGPYWFGVFGAIMLLGEIQDGREVHEMARRGCDWERQCLGSFYISPNYPGRSSHVCSGGFLVTDASRNRGVGRLMGEIYLDWAPKLVSRTLRLAMPMPLVGGSSTRLNMSRDTRIRSSTSSTKPMSLLVGYGMLWASNV